MLRFCVCSRVFCVLLACVCVCVCVRVYCVHCVRCEYVFMYVSVMCTKTCMHICMNACKDTVVRADCIAVGSFVVHVAFTSLQHARAGNPPSVSTFTSFDLHQPLST